MSSFRSFSALLIVVAAASAGSAAPPKQAPPREVLPPTLSWVREIEFVQMFAAIVSGRPPNGQSGWFHAGQSAYGLKWLAERMDRDGDGLVSKAEFTGPAELFDRLDRDHDGRLTRSDFDWSGEAEINRQMRIADALFGRADADRDEKLTAAEWQEMFRKAAGGKETLTRSELHALLFPPPPSRKAGQGMPSPSMLLKGLFEGEIGSFREGPSLGRLAPDFTLRAFDGSKSVRLSRFRGHKPVVLIFGSFT